jgi:hypothetical protein
MMRFVLSPVLALILALAATVATSGAAMAADSDQTSGFQKYPPDAVEGLYHGCLNHKDLPADKAQPICRCYTVLLQADVPYSVFAKTNADLKAKGPEGLDAAGKAAMEKNANVADYCRLKEGAAGSAEERGTFPESAVPALHASCMNFDDVAADKRPQFCGCYESLVRTKIAYSDWRLLSLAIATKGIEHLDPQESDIFGQVRTARLSCAAMK